MTIIPFFLQYPLLGLKSYEFERWVSLVDILYQQKHVGDLLSHRDALLDFALILLGRKAAQLSLRRSAELNSKRNNVRKEVRSKVLINWLKGLSDVPSKEAKLALKTDISLALQALKELN